MAWRGGIFFNDDMILCYCCTTLNSTQHNSTPFSTTSMELNGILVVVSSVTEYGVDEDNTI